MALNIENLLITADEQSRDYLRETYKAAWDNSTDKVTMTGALIVNHNPIALHGFNHISHGVRNIPEWNDKPLKYDAMIHAEIDAITKAARLGISTESSTMYMPWVPCTRCYTAIKNAGIIKLVSHKELINLSPPRWEEDLNKTLFLAEKDGFEIILYSGKIGGVKSLFNGEVWEP